MESSIHVLLNSVDYKLHPPQLYWYGQGQLHTGTSSSLMFGGRVDADTGAVAMHFPFLGC